MQVEISDRGPGHVDRRAGVAVDGDPHPVGEQFEPGDLALPAVAGRADVGFVGAQGDAAAPLIWH